MRLAHVFGIANFLLGYEARQDREGLAEDVVAVVRKHLSERAPTPPSPPSQREVGKLFVSPPPTGWGSERGWGTFAVRAKRADKSFPENSQEIERRVGAAIAEATGLRVDLEHPDLTVHIEIVERTAFVLLEKSEGPGGLPVGVSGRVLALLSSGFDSPVASWRMMRRGCIVDFIHFHSYPYTSDASIRNVEEIVRVLQPWQQERGRLHLVSLIDYQKAVMTEAPAALRVLLYRRMMVRVAERIARQLGAEALVTGENLGQVASQTIPNMAVVEVVAERPVFRPLLGYDKLEIIREAEMIGTAAISTRPYDDCCSLFTPTHPSTRARGGDLDAAEAVLGAGEWVERLVASAEQRL
ncbi:MAG: tRNA uracil 4-sulfurtransferase ThiI [bacterium]|nr:tRNA uracil 4-sulfurtransferase ThiI [bacterium]